MIEKNDAKKQEEALRGSKYPPQFKLDTNEVIQRSVWVHNFNGDQFMYPCAQPNSLTHQKPKSPQQNQPAHQLPMPHTLSTKHHTTPSIKYNTQEQHI